MKRSVNVKADLKRKVVFASLAIFLTSLWLYSSGNVYYLDADPIVVNALAGHQVSVTLSRSGSSLDADAAITLESLNPEIANVDGSVVIPAGTKSVDVAVWALQPGSAG